MANKEPAPRCPDCQRVTRRIYERDRRKTSNGYAPRGWMCDCELVISPVGARFAFHIRRGAAGDVVLSHQELQHIIDQALAEKAEQQEIEELHNKPTIRQRPPQPIDSRTQGAISPEYICPTCREVVINWAQHPHPAPG